MKMDFNFSSVVYTLAMVAYVLYSWTKKGKEKEKKKSKSRSEHRSETPPEKPAYKEPDEQLPDWLRELLDEDVPADETNGKQKPVAQPTPVAAKPMLQPVVKSAGRPSSQPVVRHRDSQEVLETDRSSLEYIGNETRSLEEGKSPYEIFNESRTTNPAQQNASGTQSQSAPATRSVGEMTEAPGYWQHSDLRRAIIWSEILKPHPEQKSHHF